MEQMDLYHVIDLVYDSGTLRSVLSFWCSLPNWMLWWRSHSLVG